MAHVVKSCKNNYQDWDVEDPRKKKPKTPQNPNQPDNKCVLDNLTKSGWTINIWCFKKTSSSVLNFLQFLQSAVGCIHLPQEKQMEAKNLAKFLNVTARKKKKEKENLLRNLGIFIFSECLTKFCRIFSWLVMNQVIVGWYFVVAGIQERFTSSSWNFSEFFRFLAPSAHRETQRMETHIFGLKKTLSSWAK